MKIALEIAVPVFNSLIALILALYYYSAFSDGKNKHYIILLICSSSVFSLSLISIKTAYINFIITTVCTYLYTYIYKIKWYNRILLTTSYVAINIIAEMISALSIMMFFNVTIQDIKDGWLNLLGIILSKVFMLVIITIIIYSRHRLLFGNFKLYWSYLYSLPLATAVVLVAQHYSLYYFPNDNTLKIVSAIGMFMLISSNLLIFKIMDNIHNTIVTENKLSLAVEFIKKQSEQYEQILYGNQNIIKIQHDHKNALIGLISEIECKNYDAIEAKLKADLIELEKLDYKMITGNSYIDVVLSYKTVEAERKGIDIICKHNNVSNLKLTGVDISVLLGNALDNAIEASQKLVDNKIISVIIANKNNYIWITVINNVEENVDVDNMITRKIQKEYHGIGIVTMKAIVEKYDGEIYFECENKQFKTIIIFPIGDE